MELKHLQAFVLVAKYKSFSKACQHCSLSQPTLSRLIKQLESELGIELFDRYQRPLQLTEAGSFFYEKVNHILAELATATQLTKNIATPNNAVTIGFVPSVLYGLLPEVIAKFKKTNPSVTVNLQDISSYKQIDALKQGNIDIGFGRFALNTNSIRQILLRHEKYVVAVPKAHHFFSHYLQNANAKPKQKTPIHLKDVINDTVILYHQTHFQKNIEHTNQQTEPLLRVFSELGIQPTHTKKVSDIQVALGLVAAGEGITLVPSSLTTERINQIVYMPLVHENATAPIYLQLLANRPHPLAESLLAVIYSLYEEKGITYRKQTISNV